MAITIRNKKTEELIRTISRRTGEGPSAIVRRLVEREAVGGQNVSEEEIRRRMALFQELSRKYPPPNPPPAWSEVEREMDSLYDYLEGEPPLSARHERT